MSNALTLSKPGMWAEVHRDSEDMWQIITRQVELTKKITRFPELATLLEEAMMALDEGVRGGPYIAAADVIHCARQRLADHQRQQAEGQPDAPRHGTGPQFSPNGHDAPKAVAQ